MSKESDERSRAIRSVRETETDYAGTDGYKYFRKREVISSEWNSEQVMKGDISVNNLTN